MHQGVFFGYVCAYQEEWRVFDTRINAGLTQQSSRRIRNDFFHGDHFLWSEAATARDQASWVAAVRELVDRDKKIKTRQARGLPRTTAIGGAEA
ncbi:hypothetical protein AO392_16305 [Pseudomonas putida]|nr:hypothetical protein AO392_16305 [Pseudomonas putida]